MMSVDKFGRHLSVGQSQRGPKGDGFEHTPDGNFNIQNKRLCNVANAVDNKDCVNLETLNLSLGNYISTIDEKLKEKDKNVEISLGNCLTKNDHKVFDAKSGIISNLSKPKHMYDAVNFLYFAESIADITFAIYSLLHKKKKKKTKKEWTDFVMDHKTIDWSELFSVREEHPNKEEVRDKPLPNSNA
jgi:hypothetical protein